MDIRELSQVSRIFLGESAASKTPLEELLIDPRRLHIFDSEDVAAYINLIEKLEAYNISGLNYLKSALKDRAYQLEQSRSNSNQNEPANNFVSMRFFISSWLKGEHNCIGFKDCAYVFQCNGNYYRHYEDNAELIDDLSHENIERKINEGRWVAIDQETAEGCGKNHYHDEYKCAIYSIVSKIV